MGVMYIEGVVIGPTCLTRGRLILRMPWTGIEVPVPPRVALAGQVIEIREPRFIRGKIAGFDFVAEAIPLEELDRADGRELDTLIGARTMEQGEIRLDPQTGILDLEGLRRREFAEFSGLTGVQR